MKKKIVINSLWLIGAQIIARLIGFFYFVFLSRLLPVADFGIYNWVLGLVYNFLPVADFGLERYILKHIPRTPKKINFYFSRLLSLKLCLSFFAFLFVLTLGFFLGANKEKMLLLFIFALHLFPYGFIYTLATFKNAQEKTKMAALFNIAYSILGSILGLALWPKFKLAGVLGAYFLGACLLLPYFARKKEPTHFRFKWDQKFFLQVIKESWVYAVFIILEIFYLRLPLILIEKILGDYQVGLYSAVSKFIEAGILIPQAINLALAPSYSRLLKKTSSQIRAAYWRDFKFIAFFSFLIGAIVFLAAAPTINVFYGPRYLPAAKTFSYLGIAIALIFINSLFTNVIQNSSQTKRYLPWIFLKFIAVAIGGIFLVSRWGIVGGAFMIIGGEIFSFFVNTFFILSLF